MNVFPSPGRGKMGPESEYVGADPVMARNIVAKRLIAMRLVPLPRPDRASRHLAADALPG